MKKLLSIALMMAMLLASFTAVYAAGYTDIKNSPAKAAIEELSDKGILEGYGDGTFLPKKNITRAEMVKVVLLTLKEKVTERTSHTQFEDVDADAWYAAYVQRGVKKGIIEGKSPVVFDPKGNVTYDQAIAMVVRAMGFSESKLKGSYPECFTNKAEELGILKGLQKGSEPATREHVAQLMSNMMAWAEKNDSQEGIKLISTKEPAIVYDYTEVADNQYKLYVLQAGRKVTYVCDDDVLPPAEQLQPCFWMLDARNGEVLEMVPFEKDEDNGLFVTNVVPMENPIEVNKETGVVHITYDDESNQFLTCDPNAVVYVYDLDEEDAAKAWTVKSLSYLSGIKASEKNTVLTISFYDSIEEKKPYEEYNYIVVLKSKNGLQSLLPVEPEQPSEPIEGPVD